MPEIRPLHDRAPVPRQLRGGAGFTLIELMVTLAIVAILAMVAAPVMTGVINASRLSGHTTDIVTTLQLARSEAVRRNANIRVCGSANGTTCGGDWTNWLIVDASNAVLQTGMAQPPVQISASAAVLTYRPNGFTNAATITVCIPTSSPADNQRIVSVTAAGQVSTDRANGGGACS